MTIGELKNQTFKFTSGTDSTLKLTVTRGKKNWVVTMRQKLDDGTVKTGCRAYFDLTGEEKEIQAEYTRLVKEAQEAGWTLKAQESSSAGGFTSVPQAPGVKKPVAMAAQTGGGQTSKESMAAKGGRN